MTCLRNAKKCVSASVIQLYYVKYTSGLLFTTQQSLLIVVQYFATLSAIRLKTYTLAVVKGSWRNTVDCGKRGQYLPSSVLTCSAAWWHKWSRSSPTILCQAYSHGHNWLRIIACQEIQLLLQPPSTLNLFCRAEKCEHQVLDIRFAPGAKDFPWRCTRFLYIPQQIWVRQRSSQRISHTFSHPSKRCAPKKAAFLEGLRTEALLMFEDPY